MTQIEFLVIAKFRVKWWRSWFSRNVFLRIFQCEWRGTISSVLHLGIRCFQRKIWCLCTGKTYSWFRISPASFTRKALTSSQRALWFVVKLLLFFKARSKKCCSKVFLEAYKLIYESTDYEVQNIHHINIRFFNSFFKAFAKKESDQLSKEKNEKQLKRRKLNNWFVLKFLVFVLFGILVIYRAIHFDIR